MNRLRRGGLAPDVLLELLDGSPVRLSEAWGNGRCALLIFLRHLA